MVLTVLLELPARVLPFFTFMWGRQSKPQKKNVRTILNDASHLRQQEKCYKQDIRLPTAVYGIFILQPFLKGCFILFYDGVSWLAWPSWTKWRGSSNSSCSSELHYWLLKVLKSRVLWLEHQAWSLNGVAWADSSPNKITWFRATKC